MYDTPDMERENYESCREDDREFDRDRLTVAEVREQVAEELGMNKENIKVVKKEVKDIKKESRLAQDIELVEDERNEGHHNDMRV